MERQANHHVPTKYVDVNGSRSRVLYPFENTPHQIQIELRKFLQTDVMSTLMKNLCTTSDRIAMQHNIVNRRMIRLEVWDQKRQEEITTLHNQLMSLTPDRSTALPMNPWEEYLSGDAAAAKMRIQVHLRHVHPTHPWWLRFFAERSAVKKHPQVKAIQQVLHKKQTVYDGKKDRFHAGLADRKQKLQKLLEQQREQEEILLDEIQSWASETRERTIWFTQIYPERAVDVINEYIQNKLDDLDEQSLLDYFCWTFDRFREYRWNQHVPPLYDNYLRPLFGNLTSQELLVWHRDGGRSALQELMQSYIDTRMLHRHWFNDNHPTFRDYRDDYRAFLGWMIVSALQRTTTALAAAFPEAKPTFLFFARTKSAEETPGMIPNEYDTEKEPARLKSRIVFHIAGKAIEARSPQECTNLFIRSIGGREKMRGLPKKILSEIGSSLYMLAQTCHRPNPKLKAIKNPRVRRISGATHRFWNRPINAANRRVFIRFHNEQGSRTLEVLAIPTRDQAYRSHPFPRIDG